MMIKPLVLILALGLGACAHQQIDPAPGKDIVCYIPGDARTSSFTVFTNTRQGCLDIGGIIRKSF